MSWSLQSIVGLMVAVGQTSAPNSSRSSSRSHPQCLCYIECSLDSFQFGVLLLCASVAVSKSLRTRDSSASSLRGSRLGIRYCRDSRLLFDVLLFWPSGLLLWPSIILLSCPATARSCPIHGQELHQETKAIDTPSQKQEGRLPRTCYRNRSCYALRQHVLIGCTMSLSSW